MKVKSNIDSGMFRAMQLAAATDVYKRQDYIYGYSKNGYRFDVQYRKVIEDTISSDHRPVQVIVQVKGK